MAKDPVDFTRKTLKVLFTDEELKNCTLPPKRDHLRREALDEKRFKYVLGLERLCLFFYKLFLFSFRDY